MEQQGQGLIASWNPLSALSYGSAPAAPIVEHGWPVPCVRGEQSQRVGHRLELIYLPMGQSEVIFQDLKSDGSQERQDPS